MKRRKPALATRRGVPSMGRNKSRGIALLALLALLTMGSLYAFFAYLSPVAQQAMREQRTLLALREAKEALISHAQRYRDTQLALDVNVDESDDQAMYGYLPMPDIGKRGTTTDTNCRDAAGYPLEGCAAPSPSGVTRVAAGQPDANYLPTLVGRLPWRTLGIPPLRDGNGECLWLMVSSLHLSGNDANTGLAFNADAPGYIDVSNTMGVATPAAPHARAVAVVFSPGAIVGTQTRGRAANGDDVTECDGNYDAANYLEIAESHSDLARHIANRLGQKNSAIDASDTLANHYSARLEKPLRVITAGQLQKSNSTNQLAYACADGQCSIASNDLGVSLGSSELFAKVRASIGYRNDLKEFLDKAAQYLPAAFATGRIPQLTCYYLNPAQGEVAYSCLTTTGVNMANSADPVNLDALSDRTPPRGYWRHYRDLLFVSKPGSGSYTVNGDSNCRGVLVFANQRNDTQARITDAERANLDNYLENKGSSGNALDERNLLNLFTQSAPQPSGTRFTGDSVLAPLASQAIDQDIVRCVPGTASPPTLVTSSGLSATQQLVRFDSATNTLTLGRENVTNATAPPNALFGCAWLPDAIELGSSFRAYFRMSFADLGTVGNTGFTFALLDALSNANAAGTFLPPCGSAGSHLGYSGNNGSTPPLNFPKIGIEFDQSRNSSYPQGNVAQQESLNARRDDPCYTCGSGTADSHVGIVYWGHEAANAVDDIVSPQFDDNLHGVPTAASLSGPRRPPGNPRNDSAGVTAVDMRNGGDIFHVRIEITPQRLPAASAELSKTSVQVSVFTLPESDTTTNLREAMKDVSRPLAQLYPDYSSSTSLKTATSTADIYDVAGSACSAGVCPTGQACGTDNVCYRRGLYNVRAGFTNSQRTQDQQVTISDIRTTWQP